MKAKTAAKAAPSDDIATSIIDELILSGHARRLKQKTAPYTEIAIIRCLDKGISPVVWDRLGIKYQDMIWWNEAVTVWTADVGSRMPVRLDPATFPVIAPLLPAKDGQVIAVVGILKWTDLNSYDGA